MTMRLTAACAVIVTAIPFLAARNPGMPPECYTVRVERGDDEENLLLRSDRPTGAAADRELARERGRVWQPWPGATGYVCPWPPGWRC